MDDRVVPLLGVTGAFVGTSGRFLGAALATILLGPWLACPVLALVEPRLLVLDEPSANLDPRARRELLDCWRATIWSSPPASTAPGETATAHG